MEVGCNKLVVESNTNKMMISELKAAGNRKGNRFKIAIKDAFSTKNKTVRIADALEAVMASGRLYAHKSVAGSPFFQQARDFPACTKGKAKNDAIDAVATGVANLKLLPKLWRDGVKMIGGGLGRASSVVANPGSKGPGDRLPGRNRFASIGRRRF